MMKRLTQSIVEIEESDTLSSITAWIHKHKDGPGEALVDVSQWVNDLNPGDIIIFNSTSGQYRINVWLKPLVQKKGKKRDKKSNRPHHLPH